MNAITEDFGTVQRASRGRRAGARALDWVAVLGMPWSVVVLGVPWSLAAPQLIVVVVPVLLVSTVAAVGSALACRLPNGDRLTLGQLLTGLAVVRTDSSHRIVRAREIDGPLRPTRRSVVLGGVCFALASVPAAVVLAGIAGFVAVIT